MKFIEFGNALVNTAAIRKVRSGKLESGKWTIELHLLGDESFELEAFVKKSARDKRLRELRGELKNGV